MNARLALLCSVCAAAASACGGGGGGSKPPPPPANSAPTITVPSAVGGTAPSYGFVLPTGGIQSLQFTATDPEGDSLQWTASVDGAAVAAGVGYSSPVAGNAFVLTFDPVVAPVASLVTLLVEDPRGAAAAIDILVVRSGPPTITGVTPSSAFVGRPQQVEVTGTALRLGGAVTTNVRFDGVLATGVQVLSDTLLRCSTPTAGSPGQTIVAVDHAYGTAALPGTGFTLFSFPPAFAAMDTRIDATVAAEPALVADGVVLHAVWTETGVVYHRRSTDGGLSWLPAQSISGAESATEPQLLAAGGEVLVGWIGDGQAVRIRRSTDGGAMFAPSQRIDPAVVGTVASRPRFCQGGDRRFAAWITGDGGAGTARVVATGSSDDGATWETPIPVEDLANQTEHSIATNGTVAWVVCLDERTGAGSRGVYASRTTNGGASWSTMRRLSQAGVVSAEPCLTSRANRVHVGWVQAGSLFYGGSVDAGASWASAPTEVQNVATGVVSAPSIACGTDRVWMAYVQAGTTAWVSRFAGTGSTANHTQVDADAAADAQVRIGAVGDYVFTAWRQGNLGDGSARVLHAVSTDGGATFTAAAGQGDGTAAQDQPCLAFDGARLVLGWLDSRNPSVAYYVNRAAP